MTETEYGVRWPDGHIQPIWARSVAVNIAARGEGRSVVRRVTETTRVIGDWEEVQ